jgi:hypothetical protein
MKKLYDFLCEKQMNPDWPGSWHRVQPSHTLCQRLNDLAVRSLPLESFVTTYNDYNYNKMATQFGVSVEEVKSWLLDPEYQRYSDNANSKIAVLSAEQESVLRAELSDFLKLEASTLLMRIQVQAPGEMIALHLDPLKTRLFGTNDQSIHRYAWFLEDQKPGQIWLMNEQAIQWKAGDLVYFDNTRLPHATANIGYHDRYVMIITGTTVN